MGKFWGEEKVAHVKKGHLVKPPQWWKHLKEWKRVFWKRHRKAEQREIKKDTE